MSNLHRRLLAIAAIVSIASTIGAHILAMQGFAYARMFSEYQKSMSANEAFDLTFSGEELCGICAAVDEIQADMNKALGDFSQQITQLHLLVISCETVSLQPLVRHAKRQTTRNKAPENAVLTLATPPPRNVAA